MDMRARVRELKDRMLNSWGWDVETVEAWWSAPNILFKSKTPDELTSNPSEFKRLETLIRFSTIPKSWGAPEPTKQLPLE